MRAATLIIICGFLLSALRPSVQAEQRESLGRKSGSSQRISLPQPMPVSWAGRAMLEEDMWDQANPGQVPRSLLNHHVEGGPGKARQAQQRKARQLTGFSGGSSASAASSASRASFSSGASSASSLSSSAASASRSSSASSSSGNSVSAAQGASQLRTSYVPPSYRGPTTTSASGAPTVRNGLTTGYPAYGVSTAIPRGPRLATTYPHRTVYTSRPYVNTYPSGYTLLFIPYYSPDYSGHHWAVYNDYNNFYGFDDNDATPGDYDYEDSHDLPAGCQYLNPQLSDMVGSSRDLASAQPPNLARTYGSGNAGAPAPAHSIAIPAAMAPVQAPTPGAYTGRRAMLSVSPSYVAPAPAPERSSRDIQIAPAAQEASQSSNATQPRLFNLLCKPIAAKRDPSSDTSNDTSSNNTLSIVLVTVIPVAVFIGIFAGVYFYLHRSKPR